MLASKKLCLNAKVVDFQTHIGLLNMHGQDSSEYFCCLSVLFFLSQVHFPDVERVEWLNKVKH